MSSEQYREQKISQAARAAAWEGKPITFGESLFAGLVLRVSFNL